MGDERAIAPEEVKEAEKPERRTSSPAMSQSSVLASSNSARLALLGPVTYSDTEGVCRVHAGFNWFVPWLQLTWAFESEDERWREVIGEDSTAFDHVAHVCVPKGVRVRVAPHAAAEDVGIIPFDTRVKIHRKTKHGWCYITVLPQQVGPGTSEIAGATGFVEGRFLLLDPPDTGSFLHMVQPGEGAASVAAKYFKPPEGFTTGYDAWLFVSALYAVNRDGLRTAEGTYPDPIERRSVSLGWRKTILRWASEEEAMKIYLGVRLKEGHALWIPSLDKVFELKAAGQIQSAAIFASGGYGAGFLRGVIDGLADGLKDLYEDAKDLARLLYDVLFEGKLFERVQEFADKIGKLIENFDLGKAVAAGQKSVIEFVEKWMHSDGFYRGHFQGHVMGYLIVLVLPMLLSAGASALARAPRAARLLKVLASIMDPGELVGDFTKAMRAAGLTERVLGSTRIAREGIVKMPFPGGPKGIEEHFDKILDEAFGEHEPWGGFVFDNESPSMFRPDERRINLGVRSRTMFTVAEEVQHALDYTLGAKSADEIARVARLRGIPDEEISDWWHRRVFTRMIKNIHEERFGLGYLKPYLQEVYERGYKAVGGKLSLETILASEWKDIY